MERIADEIIELAAEDPHLGAKVAGISPLISVLAIRLYVIGWLRDPAHALRELPFVREAAARAGYPEQALWTSAFEMELRYALGNTEGVYELAQLATRLAENLGATNELCAATSRSEALACAENWGSVSDLATDTLQRVRAHGAGRLWEPKVPALIGTAELKRGNSATSRVAAQEGVAFMRESQSAWNPHCYAVLAHAQLALTEPAADIAATLDEYEALLTRTGHHLYEGELHELRAKLAAREGHPAERTAALARAHACYTRFGMLTQAARIAGLQQA